ncbi:hypothetical protein D3C84_1222320 [compost metagenome]
MSHAQCGGQILTEDFQIDFGVAVIDDTLILDEITRESRAGNHVLRAFMNGEIGNILCASQHQFAAIFIREA